jgi:glycosyltransferase involved in cell wall biosynthesis
MGKPRVLIGILNRRNPGAISTVTRAIIDGLSSTYMFFPHTADRRADSTRLSDFNLLNLLFFARDYMLWVARLLRFRPHIVHYPVTSYWNLEKSVLFLKTARLLRAKSVGHLHGGAFIDFWKDLGSTRKRRSRNELRRLDAFIVLSDGWKKRVEEEVGLDSRDLHVVYNPLDREFEREALTMPAGREGGIVLSLGVIGKLKGLFDLIEAGRISGARAGLRFVLAGPEREPNAVSDAKSLIREYHLEQCVELRDGVWGEEKTALFREAAAFVLPSYFENLPMVILEAAAAGLPIITTPVGALPEFFVDKESAIFVRPGDVRQLAASIVGIMENPKKKADMGNAARMVFHQHFSRERIMASLDRVYRRVLNPGGEEHESHRSEARRNNVY